MTSKPQLQPVSLPSGKNAPLRREVRGVPALGATIRELRKQSGFTLAEAAGVCGVGVRFLLELEHGKPTASLGKTLQVLDRMGLEVWVKTRGQGPWR